METETRIHRLAELLATNDQYRELAEKLRKILSQAEKASPLAKAIEEAAKKPTSFDSQNLKLDWSMVGVETVDTKKQKKRSNRRLKTKKAINARKRRRK